MGAVGRIAALTVTRQIDRDDVELRSKHRRLPGPERFVTGPSVNKNQGVIARAVFSEMNLARRPVEQSAKRRGRSQPADSRSLANKSAQTRANLLISRAPAYVSSIAWKELMTSSGPCP